MRMAYIFIAIKKNGFLLFCVPGKMFILWPEFPYDSTYAKRNHLENILFSLIIMSTKI